MLKLWHALLGGCYVEGDYLRNAFRWKDTVGPWEERPGHYGDVWNYWSDDGFGFFEGLQVGFPFINSCIYGYLIFLIELRNRSICFSSS